MTDAENSHRGCLWPRKRAPRADAQRNRDGLIEAAKEGLAVTGPEVSLEEIARRAGVGIGTLYRHFPTRAAIIEAVYRRELEHLAESAPRLAETLPPAEALHEWMRLFVDYIATKRGIASALSSMVEKSPDLYAESARLITGAVTLLVTRAAEAGAIRGDVDANDLLRAMIGVAYGNDNPGWRESALRLFDILMDGLRSGAPRNG